MKRRNTKIFYFKQEEEDFTKIPKRIYQRILDAKL